jgi:hypothetical protein
MVMAKCGGSSATEPDEADFDDGDEADFVGDVWEPTGDALTALEITNAFWLAGYAVRWIELEPCHRVWIIRLRREAAPKITDQNEFNRHIRDVLRKVQICFQKTSDLTAQQTGNRALIAFLCPPAGYNSKL